MSTVKGVDISSWQHLGGGGIDWEKVHEAGVEFVLVKATQGDGYTNPWLTRDLDDARAEGLLVGAYHFAETGVDGKAQGEAFVSAVMGQALDLGAWIDWEVGPLADYEVGSLYTPMLEAIEAARRPCGLYVDDSWRETFARLALPIRRLWLAAPSGVPTGVRPMIVQTGSGTVDGIAGPVDLDVLVSGRGVNLPTAPRPRPAPVPLDPRPDHERAKEMASDIVEAARALAGMGPKGLEEITEAHVAPVEEPPARPEG